ncbi:gp12 short tail fibers [Yersinia phage phiR1-RT]|uniref:Gp12 short tail fibers n=1 Tax=Yersinia phage phiR1-RT TaxID=1206558 RepID=I7J3Y5_BPPR1|nr:tail collar fiber protein [Yersinia phage phiR1-RT]CCI88733.1 gp12 short tail fibers [Yersinia phage phiR1-RT]
MSQNNINHISDSSSYVTFNPTGTQWPVTVVNVQQALADIGSWATVSGGLPIASETVAGISRIATSDEILAGTDDTTIVTPKKLNARLQYPQATELQFGIVKLATTADSTGFVKDDVVITPLKLGQVFNTITANTARNGTVKITSSPQAQAGTDNTTATSPARVLEMINKFAIVPGDYAPATETSIGLVYLANTAQVAAGDIRAGYAVSPYSFKNTQASTVQVGTTRLATLAELKNGESNLSVSPSILQQMDANNLTKGLVKLSVNPSTAVGTALAANANVVWKTQKINGVAFTGDINVTAEQVNAYSKPEADGRFKPINAPNGTKVVINGADNIGWANMEVARCPGDTGTYTAVINLHVKFTQNGDGQQNRYLNFNVLHNGGINQQRYVNLFNAKGGSKGHYWGFEGFTTTVIRIGPLAPNSVIVLQPTANHAFQYWGYSSTVVSN